MININNLKIYKPYSINFFIDNYKMIYESMFKKYKRRLHNDYDYFITFPMVDESPLYIKGNLNNVLQYLKNIYSNNTEYIEIKNCNIKNYYSDVYKYCYFKDSTEEFICEEYRNQYGRILYYNPERNIVWNKNFFDEITQSFVYCRHKEDITFWKGSYQIIYNLQNEKWKIHRWTAFGNGIDTEYSMEDKEFIKKVIKRMGDKKYNGFYNDDIELIKNII